nr:cystathionine gamma-lyase [Quercus suber]
MAVAMASTSFLPSPSSPKVYFTHFSSSQPSVLANHQHVLVLSTALNTTFRSRCQQSTNHVSTFVAAIVRGILHISPQVIMVFHNRQTLANTGQKDELIRRDLNMVICQHSQLHNCIQIVCPVQESTSTMHSRRGSSNLHLHRVRPPRHFTYDATAPHLSEHTVVGIRPQGQVPEETGQPEKNKTPSGKRIMTVLDNSHGAPAQAFGTRAVHAGAPHDPVTGAVIEPISLSTTYAQTAVGVPVGEYEYVRSSNPNRDNFEASIASLENAKYALAFSSGSATTATILQSLAIGSHVVSISDVYGGTHRYFTKVASAHGVRVTFTPSIEQDIAGLITDETKLIWIETPSNPTLSLVDIRAITSTAHDRGIKVVVDNTFLSPYIQNPLDHGADIVVHSVTKYINGHSDVCMGVAAMNSDEVFEKLKFLQNAIGAVPSAFDCWLAHRGLKTLHLRARESSKNAALVAHALEASPSVLAVNYPGLASHKQRKIALKQHRDGMGGGMLSFRVQGGKAGAERFCQATRLFTLAESLGGIESLVEVPASMTHAGIPKEQREEAGVFDDLVRMSCGIEDGEDLVRDVQQALEGLGEAKTNGKNGHA